MDVSYRILGMLIVEFAIFLMYMAILVATFLFFTMINLDITLQFFTNSTACLLLPKLKNLSSGTGVSALTVAFQLNFDCWKRPPFVLVTLSTFGLSSFTTEL